MVSWDMDVKFSGLSPHVNELKTLAKDEKFSNIESMKRLNNGFYRLIVNNRGLEQHNFSYEIKGNK